MQAAFKQALSRFATGVCVVTYRQPQQDDISGITISAFSSLSLSPLKILFCLGNQGTNSQRFATAERFAVNILSRDQGELANVFAGQDYSSITTQLTEADTVPVLKNTLATLICDKGNSHAEGDHDIIIGKVRQILLGDESLQPLLYYKSRIITDYQHD